jgi:hypothetical protein
MSGQPEAAASFDHEAPLLRERHVHETVGKAVELRQRLIGTKTRQHDAIADAACGGGGFDGGALRTVAEG